MRYLILAALLIGAVAGVLSPPLAPLLPLEESENVVPEEYIVIFKKAASEMDVQRHMIYLNNMMELINGAYQVQHVYDMGPDLRGYAAIMNEQMLYSVRGMQEVDYVEKNQNFEWPDSDDQDESDEFDHDKVEDTDDESEMDDDEKMELSSNCTVQNLTYANWALSRISHENIQTSKLNYRYKRNESSQGEGVNIYILDSGIDVNNTDFEGRAKWGINLSGDSEIDRDGHGTKVAGCAMSKTYGVAKRATAIAVGVDRNGSLDTSLIIAGFQWVQRNHKKGKSIANASFHASSTIITAAEALVTSGVPVVTSSGNKKGDACSYAPGSSNKVITVAASDRNDNFSRYSDYGKCVDIIAPGVRVQTTGRNNNNPVTVYGTSYSAPYTCGVLATIMGTRNTTSPSKAKELLKTKFSLTGKI